MSFEDENFDILSRCEQTKPYLELVRQAADNNRNSLGFLPVSVYRELARKECLYVLSDRRAGKSEYAGHLLFTQRYPAATVIQMHIEREYRRRGFAARLIRYFCDELTSMGFTSVYASVADDLSEANAFWEVQSFFVQAVKQGGESRRRKIFRRCRELDSPQLFPPSGIGQHNPLGLVATSPAAVSLFLLDLNVLFDVSGPRRTRHEKAVSLFQAERLSICKLAISNEARNELHGTATKGRLDPMEGLVDILPSFPLKELRLSDPLFKDLASIVFPQKTLLTNNDESDLRHLATAIQHELAGLITNDSALLNAGRFLQNKYGIEVLSPDVFEVEQTDQLFSAFESKGDVELFLRPVDSQDLSEFHEFLRRQKIGVAEIAMQWLPTGTNGRVASCLGLWEGRTPVGYISWSAAGQHGNVVARIAADRGNRVADDIARILLASLLDRLPALGPTRVDLIMPPLQSITRDIATGLGFRGDPDTPGLHKIVMGGVVTAASWAEFRAQLQQKGAIKLPEHMPDFQGPDQLISVISPDGNRRYIRLDELESLLSPTLLCLPGRNAVMTPIRRFFAEPLLRHSPQSSLLPETRVSVFRDRHYISDARTLPRFKRGTLMFFYESGKGGGSSSVIAVARVRHAYLQHSEEIGDRDLDRSVLDSKSVKSVVKSEAKTITVFDNCFVLPRPIPLESLRRIGCGSSAKLITTNPITAAQAQEILRDAFGNG